MGKTLLKMQMSTAIMVLGGREKKQTCSCAGNVVQVFGFKNNFPREAGYNGVSRELPLPNKRTWKAPAQTFDNYSDAML